MIQPVSMTQAHMECYSLEESVPVLTDLLAFEKISEGKGVARLKHPNTDWELIVHEASRETSSKKMHNHFGVRVVSTSEVDAAYEYIQAHKDEYGLSQIGKPLYNHGSYSLYFLEPGTNGWEIECYEAFLQKGPGRAMFGGVRTDHWEHTLSPERFPGRGYVPQGFTHGTLACDDVAPAQEFYTKALGLGLYRAHDTVFYAKVPKDPCYIVTAVRQKWQPCSSNFRFTLRLESRGAVHEAHEWLTRAGHELGMTELTSVEDMESGCSFLLSDPNRNWWEIAAN
jgi:catechol 2,3-dioxygenase-like lactoylglutathione lyase family enzyme